MATTFSLKQGETRTSHGPIPHPLRSSIWVFIFWLQKVSIVLHKGHHFKIAYLLNLFYLLCFHSSPCDTEYPLISFLSTLLKPVVMNFLFFIHGYSCNKVCGFLQGRNVASLSTSVLDRLQKLLYWYQTMLCVFAPHSID